MAGTFSGTGNGTIGNPFLITTPTHYVDYQSYGATAAGKYFKLGNDISLASFTTDLKATFYAAHYGTLDGDGHEIKDIAIFSGLGMYIYDGCTIKNITYRVNRNLDNSGARFFARSDTYSAITLTNIHIIATGAARITQMDINNIWGSTCVINNIVFEGNIQTGFGEFQCNTQHLKYLRTRPCYSNYDFPYLAYTNSGIMSNCQMILVNHEITGVSGNSNAFFIKSGNTGTIDRSFLQGNISISFTDPNVNAAVHGMYNNGGPSSKITDSYFKGNFYVNGGNITTGWPRGKSGKIITNENTGGITSAKRFFFYGDLITPLNTNRTPLIADNNSQNADNYYCTSTISGMTPTNETGRQTGLSQAQFIDSSNFNTWDFVTVWTMGDNHPTLIDNPLYTFELPFAQTTPLTATRTNSTTINVTLTTFGADNYGFDVVNGVTIYATSSGETSANLTLPAEDRQYEIKGYVIMNGVKTYSSSINYFHYALDAAVDNNNWINEINRVAIDTPIHVPLIHGSIVHNGYIYGSSRNTGRYGPGALVRAPLGNIGAYEVIPILVSDVPLKAAPYYRSTDMEQIVYCAGYLWFLFINEDIVGNSYYICKYDPSLNTYQVFALTKSYPIAPIMTDGTYLYTSTIQYIYKWDTAIFTSAQKYNTANVALTPLATYNSYLYSFSPADGTSNGDKGIIHSYIVDGDYLYAAYTGANPGYNSTLNINLCELHKIRLSTFTHVSHIRIPKCTDDMAMNDTHLFLGIEIQPGTDSRAMGYGLGALAVRKSDMHLTFTPRLHSLDNPPTNQSYGALVFGNYLVDLRTNFYICVIDISDPDSWLSTEEIGKRTLKVYKTRYNSIQLGAPINEILYDSSAQQFYGFYWTGSYGGYAYMSQFPVPDFNFGSSLNIFFGAIRCANIYHNGLPLTVNIPI